MYFNQLLLNFDFELFLSQNIASILLHATGRIESALAGNTVTVGAIRT